MEETEDRGSAKGGHYFLSLEVLSERLAFHMVFKSHSPPNYKVALLQSLFILVENYNFAFLAGSGFSAEWPEYP